MADETAVNESPSGARVVAVVGATGGCGVTTIALHLARAFARVGPACFVEASESAGAAERLGLDRSALRTWTPDAPAADGMRLATLPMEGGFRAMFAAPDLPLADLLEGAFERVVVDGSVDAPFAGAGAVVIVVAGSRPAARRARRLLDDGAVRALVVNRTGPGGEATRAGLEGELGAPVAVELPHCVALRDAEDEGRLLRANARWCRRVDRLARSLSGAVA